MMQVAVVVVLGAVAAAVAWFRGAAETSLHPSGAPPGPCPPWSTATTSTGRRGTHPGFVVFSSSTCLACQGTWDKVQALEAEPVAVQRVDAIERKDLHDRYGIDAVPMVVVVDQAGTVRKDFVGPGDRHRPVGVARGAARARVGAPRVHRRHCGDVDPTPTWRPEPQLSVVAGSWSWWSVAGAASGCWPPGRTGGPSNT